MFCNKRVVVLIFTFYLLINTGWFARDPNVLRKVGHVLLQQPQHETKKPRHILIADDCFSLSDAQNKQLAVVLSSIENAYGSMLGVLSYLNSKLIADDNQISILCNVNVYQ